MKGGEIFALISSTKRDESFRDVNSFERKFGSGLKWNRVVEFARLFGAREFLSNSRVNSPETWEGNIEEETLLTFTSYNAVLSLPRILII